MMLVLGIQKPILLLGVFHCVNFKLICVLLLSTNVCFLAQFLIVGILFYFSNFLITKWESFYRRIVRFNIKFQ
jgi:hypothetical protein